MTQPLCSGSQMCCAAHFTEPTFLKWMERLGIQTNPNQPWRKYWEYAYVSEILDRTGCLRPGAKGVVFGVGQEPTPKLYADMGCEILMTDFPQPKKWVDTVCKKAISHERIKYRKVDMRNIPADLVDYDFCWSTCSLEHLGSIEAGIKFIEASMRCLKPNGVGVHTLEYNLSSDNQTIDQGGTVLYRRRDIIEIERRMQAAGYGVAELQFDTGDDPLDWDFRRVRQDLKRLVPIVKRLWEQQKAKNGNPPRPYYASTSYALWFVGPEYPLGPEYPR